MTSEWAGVDINQIANLKEHFTRFDLRINKPAYLINKTWRERLRLTAYWQNPDHSWRTIGSIPTLVINANQQIARE